MFLFKKHQVWFFFRLVEGGPGLWESGGDIYGTAPGDYTSVHVCVPGTVLQIHDDQYVCVLSDIRSVFIIFTVIVLVILI